MLCLSLITIDSSTWITSLVWFYFNIFCPPNPKIPKHALQPREWRRYEQKRGEREREKWCLKRWMKGVMFSTKKFKKKMNQFVSCSLNFGSLYLTFLISHFIFPKGWHYLRLYIYTKKPIYVRLSYTFYHMKLKLMLCLKTYNIYRDEDL